MAEHGAAGVGRRVRRFVAPLGAAVTVGLAVVLGSASLSTASIRTDMYVYAAGDTVFITGTGMSPTENVAVDVYFPDGTPAQADVVVATSTGDFSDTYVLPTNSPTGVYAVTAVGQTSGVSFSTTFDPTKKTVTKLKATPTSTSFGSTVTFSGTVKRNTPPGPVGPQATAVNLLSFATATCKGMASNLATDLALDASGDFSYTTSALPAGTHYVQAHYSGTNKKTDNPSTSSCVTVTVSKAAKGTTTALNAITSTVTYGSEGQTFAGHVTGQTSDGNPTGKVTVKATATTLCTATLTNTGTGKRATFTCTLTTGKKLAASSTPYSVKAHYTGGTSTNANFTYSASTSTSQSLTVDKAATATTTTLSVKSATITYGAETTETLSGTVTGLAGSGTPLGKVTINTGASPLTGCGTLALTATGTHAAKFSCSFNAKQLKAGSYSALKATYAPTATQSSSTASVSYTASTSSPAQSLTVDKAATATTTTLSVKSATITYGAETTETLSGTVTGLAGSGTPLGKVTINTGASPLTGCGTLALTATGTHAAKFSCSFNAKQLKAGSYSALKATYAPTATQSSSTASVSYNGSSSTARTLTVNKAAEGTTTVLNALSHSTVTYGSETQAF